MPLQLNGFPYWLEDIAVSHGAAVDNILGDELSKSLGENGVANSHSFFLQDLNYANSTIVSLFLPRIQNWLIEVTSNDSNVAEQDIENAVKIMYKSGRSEDIALLEKLARQKLREGLSVPHAKTWLPIMMQLNPAESLKILEVGLQQNSKANAVNSVEWFATLFGRDRHGVGVDLSSSSFTPDILLKLLRLAYQHVRVNDDVHHEGVFSPDTRDDAEGGRDAVLGALLAKTGPEGWAAKLALIDDPLFDHMKDRIVALAEHKAAQEADSDVMTEAEFIKLDEYGESSPSTTEAMFALLLDRLDDIDDLLLQDVSPREAWAGFTDERVLRRELARELDNRKNHAYRVDQEAVTADEKETDIRLRATSSNQQGVIELKLGEKPNWTAAKLRETLKEQLLKKYMAAEGCRAGILVVSIASKGGWKHPDTNANLDFEGLIVMLNEEAARLMSQHGGNIKLLAKGLDLRLRRA